MKREIKDINLNWTFQLGDDPNAWQKWYDPQGWKHVELPHDWAVEHPFSKEHSSGTGYLPGGTAWYRKRFSLPAELKGQRVFIAFEGVNKNSKVWCNSYFIGHRPYGYIPFMYDITEQVNFGEEDNLIAVRVEHEDIADSRWFTGSGITRKVHVFLADPVHIPHEGVFFTTEQISDIEHKGATTPSTGTAAVCVSVEVANKTAESQAVHVTAALSHLDKALKLESDVTLAAGEMKVVELKGTIENTELWSIYRPALHDLNVSITAGDYSDETTLRVGIRELVFDPDKGMFINGESMKMKGVCVHHDAGTLGAAVPKQVWERRLLKFIEMGTNAIRGAHNPHDPYLYELCDELGLLMIDEIYDEWEGPKNKWSTGHNVYPPKHEGNYHFFQTWHEEDVKNWIRRDRNYASVIAWSMGNEIDYPNDPYCHPLFNEMTGNNDANKPKAERMFNPDKPNAERLTVIAQQLYDLAKAQDPTRPITIAAAFPELSSYLGFTEVFDLVGYNYKEQFYEEDHKRFPDKPYYGSENGHLYEHWLAVKNNDYISGQYLWTGIDFLGEAQGWPVRGSGAGLLTMAGFPKEEFYFRKSLWSDEAVLHLSTRLSETHNPLLRYWNYAEGQAVEVRCYTNLDEAELFLGDTSLGKASLDPHHGFISWTVNFTNAELTVKAVTADGEAVVDSIRPQAVPSRIVLNHWKGSLSDNGDRIAQIEVAVVNEDGHVLDSDSSLLHVRVGEGATLLGIESGDIADLTSYTTNYRHAYRGRMIVYVRLNADRDESQPVTVSVRSTVLSPASIQI